MIAYEYIILDILYLFMHSVKKNVGRSTVSLHIAVIFAKFAELPLRIAHKFGILRAVGGFHIAQREVDSHVVADFHVRRISAR